MSAMQKRKGANGERELAHYLTERGFPSRRGRQYSGDPTAPDVISELPLHIEAKRTERLSVYAAMDQAATDSGDKPPLVCHRRNGREWLAVMRLDDLLTLLGGARP